MKFIWVIAAVLSLAACTENQEPPLNASDTIDASSLSLEPKADTGRWYTQEEVTRGNEVFAENCAGCHGQNAESTPNWKTVAANGQYPPPPLNGTAHAWHHPLDVLKMVIEQGGEPVGGVMPAWGDRLSDRQIIDVIASFQSYWPDDVYQRWLEREQSRRDSQ
ncbi:MAG TPA: cytochrome c [Saccharospirillum sp.]|nr:cytochrome c [Saccharospirillum sp.]